MFWIIDDFWYLMILMFWWFDIDWFDLTVIVSATEAIKDM